MIVHVVKTIGSPLAFALDKTEQLLSKTLAYQHEEIPDSEESKLSLYHKFRFSRDLAASSVQEMKLVNEELEGLKNMIEEDMMIVHEQSVLAHGLQFDNLDVKQQEELKQNTRNNVFTTAPGNTDTSEWELAVKRARATYRIQHLGSLRSAQENRVTIITNMENFLKICSDNA